MNNQQKEILEGIIEKTLTGNGSSDRHDITFFAIALASFGKRTLELGVEFGGSTLPFLLAAQLNDGLVTSIDIKDTTFVPPDDLKAHWRFVKSDALTFLRSLPDDEKFDVIYIDDWHTYPHVREELRLIEKHLTPTTVILMHDLMYYRSDPHYHTNPGKWKGDFDWGGPYRAVAELDDSWEWATLPWRNGLTLLRKKQALHQDSRIKMWVKRALDAISPDTKKKVQAAYRKMLGRKAFNIREKR